MITGPQRNFPAPAGEFRCQSVQSSQILTNSNTTAWPQLEICDQCSLRRGLTRGVILCLALLIAGCHQEKPERKGDLEARAGRFESAIFWYEGALGGGDRAAIHLKMAEIFANKLRDSSSAAYHYKRVLALRATGQTAETAKMALRRLETSAGSSENSMSKSAGSTRFLPPGQVAAAAEKEAKGKVRTYVVQPGDTFVSISRKFYQTASRWKDILDANQNQISNPDELKAGQTIILP
jgi:LysM repeat protein